MYGLDYLLNEVNEEDYYEPKEKKSAFDGNYVFMKVKEIKIICYRYTNLLTKLNLI